WNRPCTCTSTSAGPTGRSPGKSASRARRRNPSRAGSASTRRSTTCSSGTSGTRRSMRSA
ncbi:MAG: hypothetical protein AVDCRST_MAG53-1898, partial [uncultured Solirubrobacteraceae bacterium]